MKKFLVAAAMTLLLLAGVTLTKPWASRGDVARRERQQNSESIAERAMDQAARGDSSQGTALGAPAASALPSPVDLAAADRDLDLFGIVVNDAGVPVPGALVESFSYPWCRTNVPDVETYSHVEAGPSTRTATDGTFSLRLTRGDSVDLRVTASGYAVTVRPMCLAGEQVRILLGAPASLEVVVDGPDGAPVQDVRWV